MLLRRMLPLLACLVLALSCVADAAVHADSAAAGLALRQRVWNTTLPHLTPMSNLWHVRLVDSVAADERQARDLAQRLGFTQLGAALVEPAGVYEWRSSAKVPASALTLAHTLSGDVYHAMPGAAEDSMHGSHTAQRLLEHPEVVSAEQVRVYLTPFRQHSSPVDPLYPQQWQHPAIKMEQAWDLATGKGVTIQVSDDGIDVNHADLQANYDASLSVDLIDQDSDPSPASSIEIHGTAMAGVAVAAANNICGVGTAYDAKLAAVRMIEAVAGPPPPVRDSLITIGLSRNPEEVDIYANAWGCGGARGVCQVTPSPYRSLLDGVAKGRGGRGSIYVFAAPTESPSEVERADYNEYLSTRETIVVGSYDQGPAQDTFSSPGSCVMIVAPGGSNSGIVTTDVTGPDGHTSGDCTSDSGASLFGGTSASVPIVAGVVALMLEVNPNLGWRDVQHLLIDTAQPVAEGHQSWKTNGAGRRVSDVFGFGRVDAQAAVKSAKGHVNRYEFGAIQTDGSDLPVSIPDGGTQGASVSISVSAFRVPVGFEVEYVEMVTVIPHPLPQQLTMFLTSPSGTQCQFASARADKSVNHDVNNNEKPGYNLIWGSPCWWGEKPGGTWSLTVIDATSGSQGTVEGVSLVLYGGTPFNWFGFIAIPLMVLLVLGAAAVVVMKRREYARREAALKQEREEAIAQGRKPPSRAESNAYSTSGVGLWSGLFSSGAAKRAPGAGKNSSKRQDRLNRSQARQRAQRRASRRSNGSARQSDASGSLWLGLQSVRPEKDGKVHGDRSSKRRKGLVLAIVDHDFDPAAFPMHAAAESDDVSKVSALVASGVSLDAPSERSKASPLLVSVSKGHSDTSAALIQHGANVRAVDSEGNTALHHAADQGYAALCRMLIENGADPAAINGTGATPLDLAMASNRNEAVQYLSKRAGDTGRRSSKRRQSKNAGSRGSRSSRHSRGV